MRVIRRRLSQAAMPVTRNAIAIERVRPSANGDRSCCRRFSVAVRLAIRPTRA